VTRRLGSDSWLDGSLPGPWVADAACATQPVDLWSDPDERRGRPPKYRRYPDPHAEAKAVCRQCPVIADCLAHGIAHDEPGIWGGLSRQQRHQLRSNPA
jgi:WhiB family redox-sensing transcriptional regulator